MSGQKVTLRIDRIVVDEPGLTREALVEALQGELHAALATHGSAALGATRAVESLPAMAPPSKGNREPGLARSVASATVKVLRS